MTTPKTTIVILAHAPLASAYAELITHVQGAMPPKVYAIDVFANDTCATTQNALVRLLGSDRPCLFLTDLPGATPHNCAVAVCKTMMDTQLISAISAPLVLRAINYQQLPPQALHDKLLGLD
jgi:mannose PTS system EIIA component